MAADNTKKEAKPSALSNMEKAVGVVIAALSGWSAFQSSYVKDRVAEQSIRLEGIKVDLERSADERENKKLNHEITLAIFKEIKDVYQTPNQDPDQMLNRLLALSALVETVPEGEVRQSMANAVKSAMDNISVVLAKSNDTIKQKTEAAKSQVDIAVFRADQNEKVQGKDPHALAQAASAAKVDSPRWANYDFDFFWCSQSANPAAAKRAAELALAVAKEADPAASGRWRVRELPGAINSRPGYRISGYVIKVSSDDEQKLAGVLTGVFKQHAIPSAEGQFSVSRIDYPTPWYISVFFCPQDNAAKG